MKPKDIDLFFNRLSENFSGNVKIIILGGAGSLLMGGKRPTLDIDFEVRFNDGENIDRVKFQEAIKKTTQTTGISAQFSEDAERWSEISLSDYSEHLKTYKAFKNIAVYFLEPEYWSIGKISRYWDQDIQDMIAVFKHENIGPINLLAVWTTAISQSPLSSQLFSAKKHIFHFFKTFGRKIWDKDYPEEKILEILEKQF
ncbi:MAG: hypothetical protein COV72_05775 [Candidatus Omnitrophica bacterium CG11_big_fil_rev_8_21_14_0_20_42_13]|uniref:DUF6036 domain-containing protein n=1 Tax=Candidatus Ghiorseimicrobium undicola TaxID=1974746 RepID=A0A2H0LZL8_9BACT|nr:MAG: hypothetical protein COV72_05775 [Candidatus Omnitrophica bacterium CG11_big_fil_rev_8_21_14_0_20_42_13]